MFNGFDIREDNDGYWWLYDWFDGYDNMFRAKFYTNLEATREVKYDLSLLYGSQSKG